MEKNICTKNMTCLRGFLWLILSASFKEALSGEIQGGMYNVCYIMYQETKISYIKTILYMDNKYSNMIYSYNV